MRLPWDKKYLKISFHVIFTLTVVYVLGVLVNGAASALLKSTLRYAGSFLSAITPLIVAVAAAYLLEPIVSFYQKRYDALYTKLFPWLHAHFPIKQRSVRKKDGPRTAGVILTFMSITLFIGIFIWSIAAKLKPTAGGLSQSVSLRLAKTANDLTDFYVRVEIRLKEMGVLEYISGYLEHLMNTVLGIVQGVGNTAVRMLTSAGDGIVSFVIGLVISIYFMRDKDAIKKKLHEILDTFLPQRLSLKLKDALDDINVIFSGYIRGQLTDAVIMAVLIGGWLTIIKVDFAVMIGVFSGLSNLIPYFGALMAFALSVTVALFSGEPSTALYAAIGILVLQQIDGMFIVPKVVGESVEISPALVLLSLSVAGHLFGLVGMLLAVPVTAVIKLFLTRLMARQKERRAI